MDPVPEAHAHRLHALRAEPSRDVSGDPARLRRVALTRAEMLAQEAAIDATLEAEAGALASIGAMARARRIDHVVVLGCGDSWFVGMGVRHAFERLTARPLIAAQALDFAAFDHAGTGPGGLVVGISAGGNTPVVMDALRAARRRGAMTVGMSNTAGAPLLVEFDGGLLVHATRRGWPTQSSTATMALLVALGLAIVGEGPERTAIAAGLATAPAAGRATLAAADAAMAALGSALADAREIFFAGAGPHFATACFGAAKIRELSPVHATAFPLEELHHYRLPKRGDALILVVPDAASRPRALDTAIVGLAEGARVHALLAAADPELEGLLAGAIRVPASDAALAPIVHAPALHAFAYHFAMARDALGLGRPGEARA
jgi:glucosamine--fructose-6-phosphate aminotransferase (isomerizing)